MRRIQTFEFKLSVLILVLITFIVPANISQNGTLIVYNFGVPCDYWSIYQKSQGSYHFFNNIVNGNSGMNINILGLFANIVIIYLLVTLFKNFMKKLIN